MPSRREILAGMTGTVGGGLLTGGSVLAVTDNDTSSAEPATSQTPTPATTTVHTSTPDPTTTHTPTSMTTTASTTTTTTATSTTTSSNEPSCESNRFDCQTISTAQELGVNIRQSVVFIEVQYEGGAWSRGTGWFVDDQGHIVTNEHVINNHDEITVYTLDGEEFTPALKGRSEEPDVALLQIDTESTPIPTGSEEILEKSDPLLEVGHPGVVGAWVISLGRFEGLIQYKSKSSDLRSSVPVAQGSSGAAVVNLEGEVVGLTFGNKNEDPRLRGETPEPVDDEVHERLDRNIISAHEPISEVMEKVASWK
jgi:serine protease Do